jgi:hypothetical protein
MPARLDRDYIPTACLERCERYLRISRRDWTRDYSCAMLSFVRSFHGPKTGRRFVNYFISGYKYLSKGHQCFSTITDGQPVTFFSYAFDGQAWDRGTPITNTWISATQVAGDGIPVMWQSSDAALLARVSTMMVASPSITGTPSPPTGTLSPSSTLSAISPSGSGGLSTGGKIGLGVGIPVAVIAGLAMGFFFWRRRRRHSRQTRTEPGIGAPVHEEQRDTDPKEMSGQPTEYVHEIQSHPEAYHSRHELPEVAHR